MTKVQFNALNGRLNQIGYRLNSYSPGDGETRYTICKEADHDYFSSNRLAYAVGKREAEAMVSGFCAYYWQLNH